MTSSSAIKTKTYFTNPERAAPPASEEGLVKTTTASKSVEFPDFTRYGGTATYAVTARLAGRMNASTVAPSEHRDLLRERETLLKQKYESALSAQQLRRLEYVRWSLDRIEDAKHGESLDALEAWVEQFERFEDDLEVLTLRLNQNIKRK